MLSAAISRLYTCQIVDPTPEVVQASSRFADLLLRSVLLRYHFTEEICGSFDDVPIHYGIKL